MRMKRKRKTTTRTMTMRTTWSMMRTRWMRMKKTGRLRKRKRDSLRWRRLLKRRKGLRDGGEESSRLFNATVTVTDDSMRNQ